MQLYFSHSKQIIIKILFIFCLMFQGVAIALAASDDCCIDKMQCCEMATASCVACAPAITSHPLLVDVLRHDNSIYQLANDYLSLNIFNIWRPPTR